MNRSKANVPLQVKQKANANPANSPPGRRMMKLELNNSLV